MFSLFLAVVTVLPLPSSSIVVTIVETKYTKQMLILSCLAFIFYYRFFDVSLTPMATVQSLSFTLWYKQNRFARTYSLRAMTTRGVSQSQINTNIDTLRNSATYGSYPFSGSGTSGSLWGVNLPGDINPDFGISMSFDMTDYSAESIQIDTVYANLTATLVVDVRSLSPNTVALGDQTTKEVLVFGGRPFVSCLRYCRLISPFIRLSLCYFPSSSSPPFFPSVLLVGPFFASYPRYTCVYSTSTTDLVLNGTRVNDTYVSCPLPDTAVPAMHQLKVGIGSYVTTNPIYFTVQGEFLYSLMLLL